MSLHLVEISTLVAEGAHAVIMMDQAGWHTTAKLDIPDNLSLIPIPAKCPELNPVENIWQYMRENWLSNMVFQSGGGNPRPLLRCLEQINRRNRPHQLHRIP